VFEHSLRFSQYVRFNALTDKSVSSLFYRYIAHLKTASTAVFRKNRKKHRAFMPAAHSELKSSESQTTD